MAGNTPNRAYTKATHQSCVAHLARRVGELTKAELPTFQHGFLTQVGGILSEALAWRDDERPADERGEAAVELRDRLDVVCAGTILGEANQRFARHLQREADAIFTFLTEDCDAANWRCEQAIHPAVVFATRRAETGPMPERTLCRSSPACSSPPDS